MMIGDCKRGGIKISLPMRPARMFRVIRALSKDFYGRRMDWSSITCDATYPDSPQDSAGN